MSVAVDLPRPARSLSTPLEHALAYAARGWKIIPCEPRGKRPLTPHGKDDASSEPAVIRTWWQRWPDANIGCAMGSASGLFAVDTDPRNGGQPHFEALHDATGIWPVTFTNMTGGGGTHHLFALPANISVPSRKLADGLDLISDGKYIILPPSIHPSGRAYQWNFDADPFDGGVLAHPTAELLMRVRQAPMLSAPAHALLTPPRVQEIRSALAYISADDRDQWLHVGMALHSEAPNDQGGGLWTEWAQTSEKFNAPDQARVWRSFKGSANALTIASLFSRAYAAGWPGAPALEAPVALIRPAPARAPSAAPADLLSIPGTLNDLVRYDLMTAPRPNPQLAVQGALAFGAAVLARRFVTDSRNHSSLFLLSIAAAGTGKEHSKRTVERMLMAADLSSLLGGAGYSSSTAVFGALQSAPAHLTVIDEYGRMLESGKRSMSEHKLTAVTALMEVYGRADGMMVPTRFSSRGLTLKERLEIEAARVYCPNITLLALSSPAAFYESLNDRSVGDGFLPRFVVVESDTKRALTQDPIHAEPPDTVAAWAQHLRARSLPPGNIAAARADLAEAEPHLVVIPFSKAARGHFRELEQQILERQEELEQEGFAELFGRSRENAMRLALIVAMSVDPDAREVGIAAARWASVYVLHYAERMLAVVRERITGSEFGLWTAEARRLISGAGEKGMTARELCKYSRKLRDLTDRQFNEVTSAIVRAGHSTFVRIDSPSARGGKARQAWVVSELVEAIADNADTTPTALSAIVPAKGSTT